ncbi:MAG: heparan-alpha-glucosaminide N-acetyltransferase [Peptococcia bacterium]
MKDDNKDRRIWELDLLKGIALLLMIYFHLIYDLDLVFQTRVDSGSFFNSLSSKAAGSLFIFTAGISSYLSRNNWLRALKVLGLAMLITTVTYIYNPDFIITFGILHFLGTSIILGMIFRKFHPFFLLGLGIALILITPWLSGLAYSDHWLLFPLGLAPGLYPSADYYPLLPWFGVFLLGNGIGKLLYRQKGACSKPLMLIIFLPYLVDTLY